MTSRPEPTTRGRLSLRARLLAGLVAITAVFLVVMGVASTVVLENRLGRQFDAQLRLEAARTPSALAGRTPAGDIAAVVSRGTGKSAPLTPGPQGSELQTALAKLSPAQATGLYDKRVPVSLRLSGTTSVHAVARQIARSAVVKAGIESPAGLPVFMVVARPFSEVSSPVSGVVLAELITGGAMIALLAVSGRWLIDRGLSPLRRMAAAAHRITTGGDLGARMPDADPVTEAGQLGLSINVMLDRIEHAFAQRWRSEQKVRTFAADASHELRTPLTTIRGYAELYRQGALGPDELARAMRRIEQEATRMSQLVAELLELARLDRTSSLNLTSCDLAAIVADAAADATAVQPGRPVRVDAPPHLLAVVDEPRIRQVLANLLGNVRQHTSPDTPVLLRLAPIGDGAGDGVGDGAGDGAGHGVLVEVADAGPGMSPEDAARAFDRFHRATRSGDGRAGGAVEGSTDADSAGRGDTDGRTGGAGLGLSIVQAIAAAHGGRATLESAPARGTTVRIWLPNLQAPPQPAPPQPAPPQPAPPQPAPPQPAQPQPAPPRAQEGTPAAPLSNWY